MWRHYPQPNISNSLSKDHPSFKSSIHHLAQQLNISSSNFIPSTIEKDDKHELNYALSQISSLKTILIELAESVAEEIEFVKQDFRDELKESRDELFHILEESFKSNKEAEESHHQLNSALTQTTKQAFQQIHIMKTKQDEILNDMDSLKQGFIDIQNDQNDFFANAQKLIETNSFQVQNHSDMLKSIEKMKNSYEIEKEYEDNKQKIERINYEIKEIQNEIYNLKKKPEKAESIDKLKEIREEFLALKNDVENKIANMQRDIIKTTEDFMKGLREISQEPLKNRIEFLEEMTTTQRRELFLTITTAEQNFTKKHDKMVKALYQIARHINLPETTLVI
ncbi:unnamed protein product [Blepharisma stoltei]|uniref:Uncharacterized protein n=1 Tax=Blepharisma stoltei TaxID=1481888 RepID=A0AAU9JHH6_9CILI|nr:unnamed protein product [Blepharisma stoltei]